MADDLNAAVTLLAAQYGVAYEQMLVIVTTNIDYLTGDIDDPDSFDAVGRPSTDPEHGALGYYPVTFAPGSTMYIACQRRLAAMAAGAVDMEILDTLLDGKVALAEAAKDGAEDAQADAEAARDLAIAATASKLDAAVYLNSGIEGDAQESWAALPEGIVKVFAPFKDAAGRALAFFDGALNWTMHGARLLLGGKFWFGPHSIESSDTNWSWVVADEDSNAFAGVRENDFHLMHVGPSVRLRMLFADSANMARARGVQQLHNLAIASADTVRCLIMLYGQSLANAQEAWPSITKTAKHAMAYMIGSSVRPSTATTAAWVQMGSAALNPLVATVEAIVDSGRAPLSDATVAAFSPGNQAEGECAIIPVVNQIAKAWTDRGDAPLRRFVAVATGVNGRTIEQLSKGASPNIYQRNVDAITLHQSLATAASETANVLAYLLMQGEFNYDTSHGGTADRAAYKALLVDHRDDINGDIAAITGQAKPPAFLIYVTSASFVVDAEHASISMAQVEFALENPGVFCVGPTYPVTDKGGHLDANGSRWFGAMMAKVARRVVIDRQGWEPLYPLRIEAIGMDIFLHFHVPSGPLQFQPVYVVNTATIYVDKGFRVEDAAGFISIAAIEIIGSSIVRLSCDRAVDPGTAYVWYADKTLHNGGGNLCDSDPARSDQLYEYASGTGMYAAANIPALVDEPYPLFNWCPPFRLAVGYDRS